MSNKKKKEILLIGLEICRIKKVILLLVGCMIT